MDIWAVDPWAVDAWAAEETWAEVPAEVAHVERKEEASSEMVPSWQWLQVAEVRLGQVEAASQVEVP